MKVKEIIIEWLKNNGYDGLYDPGECGCLIGDLFPCGGDCFDCLPGYKNTPNPNSGYDFTVGPNKPSQ